MKSEILLLGLFVGFTASVLMGILFAPEEGSKMRRRFLKKGGNYSKVFWNIMDDFHESSPEKFKISKQKAEAAASKIEEN
ncbi:MAG: YtxH domain-containing protein [Chitinophagaceae bacterium]